MSDWIHRSDRLPQRADGNERGDVWIDDGLQVRMAPWDKVEGFRSIEYWQPCPVRVKPGRARRMGEESMNKGRDKGLLL